jgi:hypothetical protein
MSHSTTRIGPKGRRQLRERQDLAVKLRRGGEGYWQSGSDDPKVVDAYGLARSFRVSKDDCAYGLDPSDRNRGRSEDYSALVEPEPRRISSYAPTHRGVGSSKVRIEA